MLLVLTHQRQAGQVGLALEHLPSSRERSLDESGGRRPCWLPPSHALEQRWASEQPSSAGCSRATGNHSLQTSKAQSLPAGLRKTNRTTTWAFLAGWGFPERARVLS